MDQPSVKGPESPHAPTLSSHLERAPAMVATATAGLYVAGFLIVNSHLASKGVHDLPLVSARYVVAGGLFFAAAIVYYFFVWRKVAKRAREGIALPPDATPFQRFFLHNYWLLEDFFGCAFFSAWFIGLTASSPLTAVAQITTVVVFALDQGLFGSRIFNEAIWRKFYASAALLVFGIAVVAWVGIQKTPVLLVFVLAAVFTELSAAILTSPGWKDGSDRLWGRVYLSIYSVVLCTMFGSTVYGQLSARLGGGAAPTVIPLLNPDASPKLHDLLSSSVKTIHLLSIGEEAVVLELNAGLPDTKVVRVSRALMQGLVFHPPSAVADFQKELTAFRAKAAAPAPLAASGSAP